MGKAIGQEELDEAGPRLYCHAAPWSDRIEIGIVGRRPGERTRYLAAPLTFVDYGDTPGIRSDMPPTLTIQKTQAQELIDNLWQLGLRPSEGTGSAGALAATQKHLEDTRRLLDMVLPKALVIGPQSKGNTSG